MNPRKAPVILVLALPLLLGSCGSSTNGGTSGRTANAAATSSVPSSGPSMAPGMSMAPGSSMSPGMSMPGTSSASGAPTPKTPGVEPPSESAKMICGAETKGNVATLLGRSAPPPTKATWADHLFTCRYQLQQGQLVISVKESSDTHAARSHFDTLKRGAGKTTALTGIAALGLPAFETPSGRTVFLKDNMTLDVDASTLSSTLGPHHTTRSSFAYTVGTDILACWTGS